MFSKFFSSKKHNPKPRWGHSSVTIGNRMIVWGGTHSGLPEVHTSELKTKLTSVLEVFDVESGRWAQVTAVGTPPLGVRGHCSTVIDSDAYYFGGFCGHDWCRHNTLHCLDTVNYVWRLVEPINPNKGPMKKSRCGIVGFADGNKQYLCVFGGTGHLSHASQSNATYIPWKENPNWGWTNETHIFDFETGEWVTPIVMGDVPPACAGFTLTRISSDSAVLYGGFQPQLGGCVSDVFIIKLTRNRVQWSKLTIGGSDEDLRSLVSSSDLDYHRPVGRQDHTCVSISSPLYGHSKTTLMIMGGRDPGGNTLNDCWLLDLNNQEWRQVFYLETIAYRHFHSTSVFHLTPTCLLVVVFGGVRGWVYGKSSKHQPAISATTIMEASDVTSNGCWDLRVVRDEFDTGPSNEYLQLIKQSLTNDMQLGKKKQILLEEPQQPVLAITPDGSRSSTPSSVANSKTPVSIYEDRDSFDEQQHQPSSSSKEDIDGRVSRINNRRGSPALTSGVNSRRDSPVFTAGVNNRRDSPVFTTGGIDNRRSSPGGSNSNPPRKPSLQHNNHKAPPLPPKSPQHSLDEIQALPPKNSEKNSPSFDRDKVPPLPRKSLPNSWDQLPPLPRKASVVTHSEVEPPPVPPARRSSLSLSKIPPLPPKVLPGELPPLPAKHPPVTTTTEDDAEKPPPLPVKQKHRASPDNDLDISGSTMDLAKHGNKHKPLVSSYVYSSAPNVANRNRRESRTESIDQQSVTDVPLLMNLRDNDRQIIQSLEQQLALAISRGEEIEEQLHNAVLKAEERAVMAEEKMREMESQLHEMQEKAKVYKQSLELAQAKVCLAYSEAMHNSDDILKMQQETLFAEERAISAEESLSRVEKERDRAIEDSKKSYLLTSQMDAKIKEMERLMLKIEGEIQIANDRVIEEKRTNEHLNKKELAQLLIPHECIRPFPELMEDTDSITTSMDSLSINGSKTMISFIQKSPALFHGSRVTKLCFSDYIDDESDQWNILKSLKPLSQLRHPNIVQFIGATTDIMENDGESSIATASGRIDSCDDLSVGVMSCFVTILTDDLPTSLDGQLKQNKTFTNSQMVSISHNILSALVYLTMIELYPFVNTKLRLEDIFLEEFTHHLTQVTCYRAKLSFVEHVVLSASMGDKLASVADLTMSSVIKDFGYILLSMIMGKPIQDGDETSTAASIKLDDDKDPLKQLAYRCIEDYSILNLNDLLSDLHTLI